MKLAWGSYFNSRGVSLVEMMVVVAIMSIVALGLMTLFNENLKGQGSIAKAYSIDATHEEMRSFLANEKDCQETWQGLSPTASTNTTALRSAAILNPPTPPADSKFVAGAMLGTPQIQLVAMKLDGSQFVPSSSPDTGTALLVVTYKKPGDVTGPSIITRKINIKLTLDPITGTIAKCASEAKMTDGLWRLSALSAAQKNIFYSDGTVGIGNEAVNEFALLHAHNKTWQGSMVLSGVSDTGNTWSALYLADGMATTKASVSNQWAFAYKKESGANAERLDVVYQQRGAGQWGVTAGAVPVMTFAKPGANAAIPNGGVGIGGVSSPGAMLHVNGPSIFQDVTINGPLAVNGDLSPNGNLIVGGAITAGGNLNIAGAITAGGNLSTAGGFAAAGNISTQGGLSANGNITAGGSITSTSDRSLKKDIKPLGIDILEKLIVLQGVSYLRKDVSLNKQGREIGFIAQDVEKVFPEFVRKDKTGLRSVNYSQMVAVVIEGIKELHREQISCSDKGKKQNDRLDTIEAKLLKIERMLEQKNRN